MAVATPKLRATTTIIAEAAALLAWLSPNPHRCRKEEVSMVLNVA